MKLWFIPDAETLTGPDEIPVICAMLPKLKRTNEPVSWRKSVSCFYWVCSCSANQIFFEGYGGGFNDRQDIEYVDRDSSGDEIDDVSIRFSVCVFCNE